MLQVKRKESGSVDDGHNLVDIVLADRESFKENARLTVKPKFVASSKVEEEPNKLLVIQFFPSFYFDFHKKKRTWSTLSSSLIFQTKTRLML